MSAFKLVELASGAEKTLTEELRSFSLHLDISVAAANGQLEVNRGYFAALISATRPPELSMPAWDSYDYRIEGSDGLGSFLVSHAKPEEIRKVEFINEHAWLYVFEFDVNRPANTWFDDKKWGAGFTHPLFRERVDQSRYLFHKFTMGEAEDRWAHSIGARETPAGTDSATVVVPFLNRSLLAITCANATTGPGRPGFMPTIQAKTFHAQDAKPSITWSHFHGSSTKLPGAVSGYLMQAQGAFKAIPYHELRSWHMPAADWTVKAVADRLEEQVGRYPKMRRDLETIGEHGADSVIKPPADNLPVEVLHLTGLASPDSLI